ncbi:MAG: UDP-2,3-diacylglucosamine diphosphatase LpxI [Asticcacaulis sp.]
MPDPTAKLGLIAGGGSVPVEVARYLKQSGRDYYVIRLEGMAEAELSDHPGRDISVGHFAEIFTALVTAQVRHVCMVGYVKRPDFSTLSRDSGGETHLPAIAQAGKGGDDSLLRQVARSFEAQGFVIEGAHEANPELLLTEGLVAGPQPTEAALKDIEEAFRIATAVGALDIGQGAVVADRITLAVEAQEGTDAMLRRIPALSRPLIGNETARKGVLAKVCKPIQDRRLDMPTIGVATVEAASEAGLCGIVGQAGSILVVDKARTFARAEELGLFIYGHTAG